jgi:hypothetical protein
VKTDVAAGDAAKPKPMGCGAGKVLPKGLDQTAFSAEPGKRQ